MARTTITCIIAAALFAAVAFSREEQATLFQDPAVNRNEIVFAYAGDLWILPRAGGEARRLTTGSGVESSPCFSPDGTQIAFTGEYEGNRDIYLVPASGGGPRRLTYHPGPDNAVGWTRDGKGVLFNSTRNSATPVPRLFTIGLEGGLAAEIPLPLASRGSFSPDGNYLAYQPNIQWQPDWKKYRGGQTSPIWIAKLSDSSVERIPRDNSNDTYPMWIGDRIYFLSDRSGPVTLFSYDVQSKRIAQLLKNDGFDIKSAAATDDAIIYEQFGTLFLFDLKSNRSQQVDVRLAGDISGVRPRFEKTGGRISSYALSPTGARAVFEARGEIMTVPAEKGDVRNLTRTSGVAERYPAWSPDGNWIAYFSDESGEYALHLRQQSGMGEVKKIGLGEPPSFFYSPVWAPDNRKIAYTDKRLNLWYVDLDKGVPVKVDTNTYENPWRVFDPSWSPDSRWLTYTRQLKNRMCAVFVYSLESARSTQVTDGMSDARFANFDGSGKYLYFTASTDAGPTTGWLDMSSFPHPVTRSVYLAVLTKSLPSPLAPESDEEKEPAEKKPPEPAQEKKEPVNVTIDTDGIGQRILALPIPARNYLGMTTGKSGNLYLLESPPGTGGLTGPGPLTLHRFDLEKRKVDKMIEGIAAFAVSHNGEKMLYRQGDKWAIATTAAAPKPGEGVIKTEEMECYVDPRAEWKQMYNEVWRIERDFLYDPGFHGLDLHAAEEKYRPYLGAVAHRADLNYLFREMVSNLVLGHVFVSGGDLPTIPPVKVGLLGADYTIENGRYRFAHVFNGENWNPRLRAPLTQPGVNVSAGEYLLAVNGREVRAQDNVYRFFEATAGKAVVLKVGADPGGAGARDVTVTPIESETGLRNLYWIEENRRKVGEMSGGRLAYVYLPDTALGGFTNFNRYYFSQIDKQGAVIDERFNQGGSAADYIIDYMRRPLMNYWATREGEDFTTPIGSIYGPKVMIINEFAGSGGDLMPWLFRRAGIGPLVGKRTWGGLVGIYDYPQLIDGGSVTAPRVAFYNLQGEWDVENHGTPPDIEVELDPKAWREGHDPQLERAVQVLLEAMKKNPAPAHKKPAYPDYWRRPRP